ELPGCVSSYEDSVNTSLFRIDVIKVPLAHPEQAKIVSGARIFYGLAQPQAHGNAPSDTGAMARGGRGGRGGRIVIVNGTAVAVPADSGAPTCMSGPPGSGTSVPCTDGVVQQAREAMLAARGAGGRGGRGGGGGRAARPPGGPNQCHDITVYPSVGLAGGACG